MSAVVHGSQCQRTAWRQLSKLSRGQRCPRRLRGRDAAAPAAGLAVGQAQRRMVMAGDQVPEPAVDDERDRRRGRGAPVAQVLQVNGRHAAQRNQLVGAGADRGHGRIRARSGGLGFQHHVRPAGVNRHVHRIRPAGPAHMVQVLHRAAGPGHIRMVVRGLDVAPGQHGLGRLTQQFGSGQPGPGLGIGRDKAHPPRAGVERQSHAETLHTAQPMNGLAGALRQQGLLPSRRRHPCGRSVWRHPPPRSDASQDSGCGPPKATRPPIRARTRQERICKDLAC